MKVVIRKRRCRAGFCAGLTMAGLALAACETPSSRPFIPNLNPNVTESKDFVKANRPENPDFISVSTPDKPRPKPLSNDEVKKAESDLAELARRQQAVKTAGDAARRGVLARSPKPPKVD